MMNNTPKILKHTFLILILVFISAILNAQVVYVSVDNGVYAFLERLSLKQIIKLDDEVKPYSRVYVAQKLSDIKKQNEKLNNVETDELAFYLQEYKYEYEKLGLRQAQTDNRQAQTDNRQAQTDNRQAQTDNRQAQTDNRQAQTDNRQAQTDNRQAQTDNRQAQTDNRQARTDNRQAQTDNRQARTDNRQARTDNYAITSRWFIYSYEDSLFNLKLSPIAGYGISTTGKYSGHTRWVGASVFATYSDWFGLNFSIRDKGEFGGNVDRNKYFSPLSGAWYKGAPNGIEYSDLRGGINFNWDWGSISLIKENIQWGHGKFGQLILSAKPPSYPHIRFSIKPTEWLRFTYIHGWLNSLVKDSANFYYTYPGTISQQLVESYIPKYIAANLITVSPLNWLDVSAGNAIIYSGDLRPEFFIPFMFYKFLDHNTGRGNVNDGNGMMYFDVSVRYPANFQFYSTAFIDVTEVRNILSNDFKNTWVGFTVGGKSVNALIDNLDITIEYTRLNPWVYEHKDEVTTYKHIKYYLGNWLGQNADQLRLQFDYQLLRGLKFKAFAERIRKGGLNEIYFAYKEYDTKIFPFLYSPLRKENRIGLDITYEYMHDLFLRGTFTYSDIDDTDIIRTQQFLLGKKSSFSLSLYYGL